MIILVVVITQQQLLLLLLPLAKRWWGVFWFLLLPHYYYPCYTIMIKAWFQNNWELLRQANRIKWIIRSIIIPPLLWSLLLVVTHIKKPIFHNIFLLLYIMMIITLIIMCGIPHYFRAVIYPGISLPFFAPALRSMRLCKNIRVWSPPILNPTTKRLLLLKSAVQCVHHAAYFALHPLLHVFITIV